MSLTGVLNLHSYYINILETVDKFIRQIFIYTMLILNIYIYIYMYILETVDKFISEDSESKLIYKKKKVVKFLKSINLCKSKHLSLEVNLF